MRIPWKNIGRAIAIIALATIFVLLIRHENRKAQRAQRAVIANQR